MAYQLRVLAALAELLFNPQPPHSPSQPSIMESDTLFCHAGIHAERALIHIKKKEYNLSCGAPPGLHGKFQDSESYIVRPYLGM